MLAYTDAMDGRILRLVPRYNSGVIPNWEGLLRLEAKIMDMDKLGDSLGRKGISIDEQYGLAEFSL